jgi:predicted ATPase
VNLRKLAKGKPCTVLLEGCDGGGETTVLAHIRKAHVAGSGSEAARSDWRLELF